MSRTRRHALATIVLLGLAARLAAAAILGLGDPPEPGTDSQEYDTYAWNLAQGRGYRGMSPDVTDRDHPTAFRPPLTSLAWAGLYVGFGHRYDIVRVAHCLMGAAAIPLVFAIGRRAFGRAVGLLSAGAYAVFPTAIQLSTELLSEPLAILLFLGYVAASLRFADRPTWAYAGWAGLLLGLALLTRSAFVAMVPLAALWAAWQFRHHRRQVAMGLAIPLAAVACLVPWTVRNSLVFGRFIPLTTNGGSPLLAGNNRIVASDPDFYGYLIWDTKIPEYRDSLVAPDDEYERDQVARRLALSWLRQNPDKWGYLIQAKLYRAWTPILRERSPWHYRVGMLVSWGPVLLLSGLTFLPTLASWLRRGDPCWLIHLAILHFVAVTVVFFGQARYRTPVEPLCLILACAALASAATRVACRSCRVEEPDAMSTAA